jgi:glutathione S-transferase
MAPGLVLHVLPPSHPCMTATAALNLKGLEYERVEFAPGPHVERMRAIYGEERHTVPGMLVDGEPVHGSRAILARLEELVPEPVLYPSDTVREAELWGDEELQDLGRRLPWVLLTLGDLRPLLRGSAGERIALEFFPEYHGEVPPGAFPAGWTPAA